MVLPGSVSKNINSMRYIHLPVIIRNSSFNLCNIVALERSNSVTALDSVKSADHCGQLKLESSDLLCHQGPTGINIHARWYHPLQCHKVWASQREQGVLQQYN